GETGINAALCGTWGCPVLLVTGDRATCAEAEALLGSGLTTVAVKQGLGRYSARHIAPLRARELIEEATVAALKDTSRVVPYDPRSPGETRVEFATSDALEAYRHVPAVEIAASRPLFSRADDWLTAWRQFYRRD